MASLDEEYNGPEEEYRGPATLHDGEADHPVEIRLSARFEPVEGRFRWAGRTAPDETLRERVAGGLRQASLALPGSTAVDVRLSEPDPWGGIRLSGTGTPPWFRGFSV
ncbi:DUF4873 domain-containing protein [Paractinoplanes atraurantiacus]|uniref:DUF4873 domain-containing protein n=1 Tax=Paractinoplanes atraurantiacus TaxID=1036182 RepID=A0A285K174_9ACTN|nr:DUF4873 domain-containing protein [Actinoplanes atraurantiacus]SNY66339.1 protein of unknown function [Actinoplanes atraurantiacus]